MFERLKAWFRSPYKKRKDDEKKTARPVVRPTYQARTATTRDNIANAYRQSFIKQNEERNKTTASRISKQRKQYNYKSMVGGNSGIKRNTNSAVSFVNPLMLPKELRPEDATLENAKRAIDRHPVANSAIRGLMSGTSYGLSDLVNAKGNDDVKARNEYLTEHQGKVGRGVETATDIGSSLLSFGLASAPAKAVTKRIVKKVVPKTALRAVEKKSVGRLASSKLMQRTAKRQAVKKFGEGATESAVNKIARKNSYNLIKKLGEDAAINSTVGAASDIFQAASESDNPQEFTKNLAKYAAMNWGLGGIVTVAPDVTRALRRTGVADDVFARAVRAGSKSNADKSIAKRIDLDANLKLAQKQAQISVNELREAPIRKRKLDANLRIAQRQAKKSAETYRAVQAIEARRKEARTLLDELDKQRAELRKNLDDIKAKKKIGKTTPFEYEALEDKADAVRADIKKIDNKRRSARRLLKKAETQAQRQAEISAEPARYSRISEATNRFKQTSDLGNTNPRAREVLEDSRRFTEQAEQKVAIRNETKKSLDELDNRIDAIKKRLDEIKSQKDNATAIQQGEFNAESEALRKELKSATARRGKLAKQFGALDKDNIAIKNASAENPKVKKKPPQPKAKKSKNSGLTEYGEKAKETATTPKAEVETETLTATTPKAEAKTETPKASTASKEAKLTPEEKEAIKVLKRGTGIVDSLDSKVRRVTDNEYDINRGTKTALASADPENRKRMVKELDEFYEQVRNFQSDTGADIFENSPYAHAVNNRRVKNELIDTALTRVNNDPEAVIANLKFKIANGEHLTLQDVSDTIALNNTYKAMGIKADESISKIIAQVQINQKSEAGQALVTAHQLYMMFDKDYRLKVFTRDTENFVKAMCGAKDMEAINASIKKALEGTDSEQKDIKSFIEYLSDPENFKTEAEFKDKWGEFQTLLFRHSEPSFMDSLNLIRHFFMLSKPTTALNNILGNMMMRGMYDISDKINLLFEKSLKAKYGDEFTRTTSILRNKDQRRLANMFTSGSLGKKLSSRAGYLEGFADKQYAEYINNAAKEDIDRIMAHSKWGLKSDKGIEHVYDKTLRGQTKKFVVKLGSKGNRYVSFVLNEPDSWFVERNYRSAFLKYLNANGVVDAASYEAKPEIVRMARAHAEKVARENTYKEANSLATFLDRIKAKGYRQGASALDVAKATAIDATLPYTKVPLNLIKQNIRYSPVTMVPNIIKAGSAIKHGDIQALNHYTSALSKNLTGIGLASVGFMLTCNDQADNDSWGLIANAKDELKDYNIRDYSLKAFGKDFNLANLGIGAVQFLVGTTYAEWINENGGISKAMKENPWMLLEGLKTIVDPISDMSLLDNFKQALDSLSANGDYDKGAVDRLTNFANTTVTNYAGQFIPTPLRAIARGTTSADLDQGIRKGETSQTQRTLQRMGHNIVSGIPIANEKVLPHKVDAHGHLINERDTAGKKALSVLDNLADPFSTRKVNVPEHVKEQLRVSDLNAGANAKKFDDTREYKVTIGASKSNGYESTKEDFDITGGQREQIGRSLSRSGVDSARYVIEKKDWFGDSQGSRAQYIISHIPDNEEEASKFIMNTPEYKGWTDQKRADFWADWNEGRDRTANHEYYVNIADHSEAEFTIKNDYTARLQHMYDDVSNIVTAEEFVSAVDATTRHRYKDGKNEDEVGATKAGTIEGILSLGLSQEKNLALYDAIRGGKNWKDWDGASAASTSGYRRGSGYRRYSRSGRRSKGGSTSQVPIKVANFKAQKRTYLDLTPRRTSSVSAIPADARLEGVKIKPPRKGATR